MMCVFFLLFHPVDSVGFSVLERWKTDANTKVRHTKGGENDS